MSKLNELVEMAKASDGKWFATAINPESILAIAEAFRELEQRAEAAEAEVSRVHSIGRKHGIVAMQSASLVAFALAERVGTAEAQIAELAKQEPVSWDNIPFTFNQLKDMHGLDFALGYEKGWERKCESVKMKGDLFTRSAPAAVPVDVVPVKLKYTGSGDFYGWGLYRHDDESSQIDTDSGDLFFRSNHDVYVCARCGVKPTRPDGAHYCHKPDPDKNSK